MKTRISSMIVEQIIYISLVCMVSMMERQFRYPFYIVATSKMYHFQREDGWHPSALPLLLSFSFIDTSNGIHDRFNSDRDQLLTLLFVNLEYFNFLMNSTLL